jgi:hypothetical protein
LVIEKCGFLPKAATLVLQEGSIYSPENVDKKLAGRQKMVYVESV